MTRVAIRARNLAVGDHTVAGGEEVLAVEGPLLRSYDRRKVVRVRLRRTTGKRVVERTTDYAAEVPITVERLSP